MSKRIINQMKQRFYKKGRTVPHSEPTTIDEIRLVQATRCGDLEELRRVLNQDPGASDKINHVWECWGVSILHIAARYDQIQVMEMLLHHCADVNVWAPIWGTPLQVACGFNSISMIHLLLRHGAMRNLTPDRNGSLMCVIAEASNTEVAEMVYKNIDFPPVNYADKFGTTPLHHAAHRGNDEICTWLISRGADVNVKDNRKATPFMIACRKGNISTMQLLFAEERGLIPGRMLSDVDDEGRSCLFYTVVENKVEAAEILLNWGVNASISDNISVTPLHIAAFKGNVAMVKLLATFGANTEKRDRSGRTPLLKAAKYRQTEIISALVEMGADINAEDKDLLSALAHACIQGHVDVLLTLLHLRASLVKRSWHFYSCLHLAIKHGHLDILTLLLEDPACDDQLLSALDLDTKSVLHHAATQKDVRFLDLLTKKGCAVEERDGRGEMPLHKAARQGSYETVLRLAELTSDVNAECWELKSPFFCACEEGNREAIQALIKHGANVMDMDVMCRNTLMVAAMGGFRDIVLDLINMGLPIDPKDKERNTALHHACSRGHLSTVEALLDHQALVTNTNIHGQSPLDMAIENRRTNVAIFMMNHSSWEESLSVRNSDGLTSLDKMIELTPDAVKVVLDKCVKPSNHRSTDEEYTIEFNYKYIDPGPKDPSAKIGVYSALLAMLKWDREDLIAHPLCQSNLSYKWRGFGRVVQVSSILTQFGFMIVLYLFYFLATKPHDSEYRCRPSGTHASNNTNQTLYLSNFFDPSRRPKFEHDYMIYLERVLYVCMAIVLLWELINIIALGRKHLLSTQFLLTIVTVLLIGYATLPAGYAPCDHEWRAIAYGIQVYFVMASVFIVRYDKIGIYFVMYFEVIKTMLKVSFMLFFFLMALSVPLDVMMHEEGFKSHQPAILTTLAMTLGEIQFRDNFVKGDNSPFRFELYCLFAICCIFLNVALMNLMIGAAVGDISKVEKRAYMTRLRTQVHFLLESEAATLFNIRDWFHTQKLVLRPNKKPKTFWQMIYKELIYPEQIEFIKKTEELNQTAKSAKAIQEQMESQRKKIDELVKTTNTILDTLQKMDCQQTMVRPYTPGI